MPLSSIVLGAFSGCSGLVVCLGIGTVLSLLGEDGASPCPVTGRDWSRLGEFPLSLSVTFVISEGEGELSRGDGARPFAGMAFLTKTNTFLGGR